jgi:hypothetical protein
MSWFRYHADALDNPKVQSLPATLFKFWVNLLCVSRISDGFLPNTSEISFRCRCTERQAKEWMQELYSRKLIDKTESDQYVMHDWDEHQFVSDDVTARVRKHRAKRKGNVSETCPEQNRTETEQNRGEKPSPLAAALERISCEIHARHPEQRRDCSAAMVEKKLKAILKHQRVPVAEAEEYLETVNRNHSSLCSGDGWRKEDGVYAKALSNWLAPTQGRYEMTAPVAAKPNPVLFL